jgi:hypothetical protein
MRLSDRERNAIVSAVRFYDARAQVFLFGSRADDAKKGGADQKRRIHRSICDAIGEQKIDILVAADLSNPLVRVAQRSGVLLQ